jgi:murein tripeptide amidase MpaA
VRIRHDPPTQTPKGIARFAQWFHFRVVGPRGVTHTIRIIDADKASYTDGWKGYQAVASYDREHWFRVPTTFDGKQLVIAHTPESDAVWYAYFAPYGWDRHQALIGRCAATEHARVDVIGHTLDGRTLDRIRIGDQGPALWLIARQHPGESMAEWWMEGFLLRLLSADDPLSQRLRESAQWHIVPNMNPDGSVRGHLRTNAGGINLNRAWVDPTEEECPEVFHVLREMDASGVDFCLDVHGDEGLPYNFVAGAEGIPGWTDEMAATQKRFLDVYEAVNGDFQQVYGYPVTKPGKANLTMATNQTAHRFNCLSMTLEQPFKDAANAPQPEVGWSPDRAMALGASVLEPIADFLRTQHGIDVPEADAEV